MNEVGGYLIQVCDFGLSKMKLNTMVSGGVRGTLPWMAPELLYISSNKVSEKVKWISLYYSEKNRQSRSLESSSIVHDGLIST